MMDLGYDDRFGSSQWDDDSRGLKKKRGKMAKITRLANKSSWIFVLLLLGFVWHLHSHKKTLSKDIELHKDEKEGLMMQLNHLDTTVAQKAKEAEEYQRLHSQEASRANQHQSTLQRTQDELMHVQHAFKQCTRDLEEERKRAAERKCEDCSLVRTELNVERGQKSQLQADITHLNTQLSAVTAQLEHLKANTIPKPLETTPQQAAGGGAGGGAAGGGANQRNTHDDHIDAAIAGHGQQAVPTPIVDPNQQQQQQQEQQQHQQEQPVPVQQEAGGQRRWGRGANRVPVDVDASVHHDEHVEPVMTPDERRLKRRSGNRRKGGLSMLEEHLGVEHEEVEEIHY